MKLNGITNLSTSEPADDIVRLSDIAEGFVLVSAMHIAAGVYINDAGMGMIADIEEWLEQLTPCRLHYRHHVTGE